MPHIHEEIDFCVEVFVVCRNSVLLRKHDKYKIWLSVGGHIELNEDPIQAAIREVKEEVGLDVKIFGESNSFLDHGDFKELVPPISLNKHRIDSKHHHITFVYFASSETDSIIPSEKEVTESCKWFTKEELESSFELKPDIKFYALKALEELKS